MNIFHYVYVHCLPDGVPFYVGKGSGRRAYVLAARNSNHGAIVSMVGKGNVLIYLHECETERGAYSYERWLIRYFRKAGHKLTNVNDGGYGGDGSGSLRIKIGRQISANPILTKEQYGRIEAWRRAIEVHQKKQIYILPFC